MDLTKILIPDAERASSETPGRRSQPPVAVKCPPIWSRNYRNDVSPSSPPVSTLTTSAIPWLPDEFGFDPATPYHSTLSPSSCGMTARPGAGLAIALELDKHRALEAANEKKTKNASASASFRKRRKVKEEILQHTIHLLKGDKETLLNKIHDLEQERDFYRQRSDFYRALAVVPSRQSNGLGSFPPKRVNIDVPED